MKKIMKKTLALLLAAAMIMILPATSSLAEGVEDEATLIARQQNFVNASASVTPEQYIALMNENTYFSLRAYMYYNEDLMSKFTYDYWKYYKQYLEKGYKENRQHAFPADDSFNTVTLGRYTTKYKANTQRGTNLELACDYMNGTVVAPGQMFSYNAAVGERTSARGFKVAHVYSGGQVVDGIGGGICQISSTLYVAMMIAGIPATEHHFHSLPVSYLKTNLDATVSWGKLDLKFVNPYDYPVVIYAQSVDGLSTVTICRYTGQ